MGKRVRVGDRFRDFSLEDQDELVFVLSKFRGKRVLLSFHPLAWTSVCAEQMKSLEKKREDFDSVNTVAVGVSVDTVPSKKAWAESLGIKSTRLVSDFWPHGKVAEKYGVFRSKYGTSERANVVIDENQRVVFVKVYPVGQLPDVQEVIGFLKKLS